MSRDMWRMIPDMWHVVGVNILSRFQLTSSYGLWYFEDLEEKADWLTEWINQSIIYEGVCRTAPATPGLLITIQNLPTPKNGSPELRQV